jgi:hypothetical protein
MVRTYVAAPVVPRSHDEFSYLLGADTFRSGRLTNPPLPSPESFDTFHELQRPTYASKYPPGQALFLAAGWIIGGSPIVGVWLGFATMVAAFYWMLFAWADAKWAIAVTVLVSSWLALTYWSYSFWGGAVAAFGGALVYGAFPRLKRGPRVSAALAFGIGLAILANTRPFEGLLVAIPPMLGVARLALSREYSRASGRIRKLGAPIALVSAATVGLMALQNHAVTGHWLTIPYAEYHRQSDVAPLFLWQQPTPHAFANARRDAFRPWEMGQFDALRKRYFARVLARIGSSITFVIPGFLLFPFVLLPKVAADAIARVAVAGVACVVAGVLVSVYNEPHYFAPAAGPLVALFAVCLGRFASLAGPFAMFRARLAWVATVPALAITLLSIPGAPLHKTTHDWATARIELADSLTSTGGQHLLFVAYPPGYNPHYEWVFNGANVSSQSVIWAHDLGAVRNKELQSHFPNADAHVLTLSDSEPFYSIGPSRQR